MFGVDPPPQYELAQMIEIKRRAYTQADVERLYKSKLSTEEAPPSPCVRLKAAVNRVSIGQCLSNRMMAFPRQLTGYKWIDFGADIIAGLTVAFVRIPQGMAFAFLANVQPQYGLFTEFYCCLFYALLATSRHISFGSTSIMSMLSAEVIEKYFPELPVNASLNDNANFEIEKAAFASSFACLIGFMQVLLGVCQFHRYTC